MNEYNGTMNEADIAIVFYSKKALKHKKLEEITPTDIYQKFGKNDLQVITNAHDLVECLKKTSNGKTPIC